MMAALKNSRIAAAVVALSAVFAIPGISAAQSTTAAATLTLDRSGAPGTEIVAVLDPITGQQAVDPVSGEPKTFTRETGALVNPCSGALVDLNGTINVALTTTKTSTGVLKVVVTETTRATGGGWTTPDNFATKVATGATYAINDSQQYTASGHAGQFQISEFSDRFTMRGPTAGDNWVVRVTSTLTIDTLGRPTVTIKAVQADPVCKG